MTPLRALAAAFLLAVPAAAEPRVGLQRELLGDALADARRELRLGRDELEILQELGLTPHSSDEPVEAALLHVDLAQGYLVWAEPELFGALEPGAGRGAYEARLKEALALLRAHAPDLADVYKTVPIRPAALGGTIMARFSPAPREVLLRAYFAAAPPPAPYLAALLAHEAAHALQFPPGGEPWGEHASREYEARRRESLFWIELGAGPRSDFGTNETDQAAALRAGEKRFRTFIAQASDSEPDWNWVAPRASTGAAAPTEEAPVSTAPVDAAETLALLASSMASTRRNYVDGALERLRGARERLSETTELSAPYPKIVNADVMRIWALTPGHYPRAMTRAFAALTPVLDELDKAEAALAAASITPDERERLKRYAKDRDAARAQSPAARAVLERLLGRDAPPVYCLAYPAKLEPPTAIALPGAWQCRDGRPEIAAAWAAHVLAHRAQGLAPDARPTLEQEEAAVQAELKVWRDAGADAGFDPDHPDRFLAARVAAQAGDAALREYLAGRAYVLQDAAAAPPPAPRAKAAARRKVPRRHNFRRKRASLDDAAR